LFTNNVKKPNSQNDSGQAKEFEAKASNHWINTDFDYQRMSCSIYLSSKKFTIRPLIATRRLTSSFNVSSLKRIFPEF
jgi:hypothetical protein